MSNDLTIAQLARETGVSSATLRAWEERHDFPRPRRLPSGHRRYDESDVELILRVVALVLPERVNPRQVIMHCASDSECPVARG